MLRRVLGHRWALRIAAGALVLALAAAGVLVRASGLHRLAPPLPRRVLQGPRATLATLRGHAALIVFWASWCPGCHQEATAVERFASSARARGRVVAIDYDDAETGNARRFLARYRWTMPVLADPDGNSGSGFGLNNLPTTVALDARGRIVSRDFGPQSTSQLAAALAQAS